MSNTVEQIEQHYVAYLARPATSAELDGWQAHAAQVGIDAALGELRAQLVQSQEFADRFFPASTDNATIDLVYDGLFHTQPTADERALMVDPFFRLPYPQDKMIDIALAHATPAELAALANRVAAAEAFSTLPALDDSAHILAKAYLSGVGDDASLAAAQAQVHAAQVGGAGSDTLAGSTGADWLFGGAGNDTLQGGGGNDFLVPGTGVDIVDGGDGDDTVQLAGNAADYARRHTGDTTVLVNDATGERVALRNVEHVVFHDGSADVGVLNQDGTIVMGTVHNDDYTVSDASHLIVEQPGGGYDTVSVDFTAPGTYVVPANVETVYVTAANDVVVNVTGNDGGTDIYGNGADNTLVGGKGNDALIGGGGHDTLIGGAGDDLYRVDANTVVVENAGEGTDRVIVDDQMSAYTLGANLENFDYRGNHDFAATGNDLDNVYMGGVGNDTVLGLGGNDTLSGYVGDDLVDGGAGNDTLYGVSGSDTLLGGSGDDVLDPGNAISGPESPVGLDIADGGSGDDTVVLSASFDSYERYRINATDTLLTNTDRGENVLIRNVEHVSFDGDVKSIADVLAGAGTPGNDNLKGTIGADRLYGGAGDDTYVVNVPTDVVVEHAGEGTDLVKVAFTAADTYRLTDNVENATVTAASTVAVNLVGNDLDNVLRGNGAANVLAGGNGNDTLYGGGGKDAFVLGSSDGVTTVLDFHSGTDVLQVAQGAHAVGNGNTTIGNAVVRASAGGFAPKAELVIFTHKIAGAITADSAAASIGSATGAYADGATALFVVNNGSDSAVYQFKSHGADAVVSADELHQVATLVGAPAVTVKDFQFVA